MCGCWCYLIATIFFIVAQFRCLLNENNFHNSTAGGETTVQIWGPIRPSALNAVTLSILFPPSRLVASEDRYLNGNRDTSVKTCAQLKKKKNYRLCFTVTTFHFHFCLSGFF